MQDKIIAKIPIITRIYQQELKCCVNKIAPVEIFGKEEPCLGNPWAARFKYEPHKKDKLIILNDQIWISQVDEYDCYSPNASFTSGLEADKCPHWKLHVYMLKHHSVKAE